MPREFLDSLAARTEALRAEGLFKSERLITGPQPMFQLQFHTAFVEGASSGRPFVFYKEDLDLLQSKCPVSRVEFVPGARNDDALAAPEVKFVRKKVKRSSTSP